MEWKGLNKSVNAEETKGYHASGLIMMTNLQSGPERSRYWTPLAFNRPAIRGVD